MAKNNISIRQIATIRDPRDVPAYNVREAAHYLCIPAATLRAWVMGTSYTSQSGRKRRFLRVIDLPRPSVPLLSFFNLAEAHVLRALRVEHGVTLSIIRKALRYVAESFGWDRPLLRQEFQTDGVNLFVERLGQLLEASADGQLVMREVVSAHLARLDWEDKIVARIYPFTRPNDETAPLTVCIDPRFAFGRLMLRQAQVATSVIAERYKAGESIEELALDYGCTRLEIEEGIRCELRVPAAA